MFKNFKDQNEIINDTLLIKILKNSDFAIQKFEDLKPLCNKGKIEVIFLYGFLYIRKSKSYSNDEKFEKLSELVKFLTIKRKSLGVSGLFSFSTVSKSLMSRLINYIELFDNIEGRTIFGHKIYGAIYNSPLKKRVNENVDLIEALQISLVLVEIDNRITLY